MAMMHKALNTISRLVRETGGRKALGIRVAGAAGSGARSQRNCRSRCSSSSSSCLKGMKGNRRVGGGWGGLAMLGRHRACSCRLLLTRSSSRRGRKVGRSGS